MCSVNENVEDMLSRLPEEILSHILSLMPTKFAVQTSVLSKRWRYSWTFVTNLDFGDTRSHHFNRNNFTKFVDELLKSCKTSQVNLFRLHLFNTRARRSSVSNWIDKAVRLNVRELDVGGDKLQFPLSMFTCKTLTKLKVTRKSCHYKDWKCPSFVNLPCLQTLDVVNNSLVNVFELIRGCPMLESLSLEVRIHNEEDEEDYIFNIPTLKRLKLTYRSCTDYDVNKVVLRVPNLEYLLVNGVLHSFFVMEDVSSLVGASITCWEKTFNHLWVDLLHKIRGVQNLSIQNFPFTTALPIFPNMMHLELKGFWQSRLIPQFLGSCPNLKILCIDDVVRRILKKHKESCWIEPKSVPACMLTNLTTIKFSNCNGQKSEVEFLEYMLGNAVVLKMVTIICKNLGIEEEKGLCDELFWLPKASKYCKINVRSWKLSPSAGI